MKVEPLHSRPRDARAVELLLRSGWPPFIVADAEAARWLPRVRELFAHLELLALDGAAYVGAGWAVPIAWDGTVADLPTGYTDSLRRAVGDADAQRPASTLVLCAAQVAETHRGRGVASLLIERFRDLARDTGASALLVPLRPTRKARYPLIPIEEYASWRRGDGTPFDPWMRTHREMGAEVLAVAPASQTMTGTVAEWEAWTGVAMPGSGHYVIPEGLAPLRIDREADLGTYVEPNIWVRHPV